MDVKLDFDIYRWKLGERIAFEKATGMTCERAISLFEKAGRDSDAALDIPAAVSVGLVWIAVRRKDPKATFDDVAEQYTGQDFLDLLGASGDDEAPLAEEGAKPTTKKSSARSATTSTTPPSKSGN